MITKKEAKKKMKDMGFGTYEPLGIGFRELDKALLNFRKKLLKTLIEEKGLSEEMKNESVIIILLCEKAKNIFTEQLEKANLN